MQAASASLRFARSIAAALPSLRSVPEGPGSQLADWRELRSRYQAFMLDRGLYEASWLGRNAAGSSEKWLLLYPDLTEDWMDYQEAACSMPDGTLVLSGELGTEPVPAARFGTVVEELRAVLLTIREAVSKGADPAGIIISAAAPESVLPILEREAAVARNAPGHTRRQASVQKAQAVGSCQMPLQCQEAACHFRASAACYSTHQGHGRKATQQGDS
ncbi:hypothetical protein MASR2M48_19620 [Spirochaetota bacterium]